MTIQRPIEPGCLAMIINWPFGGASGTVITVVGRIPLRNNKFGINFGPSDSLWEISEEILWERGSTKEYKPFPVVYTQNLLRIDPDAEDFETEEGCETDLVEIGPGTNHSHSPVSKNNP